jgi:cardiolipin synthase
MHRSVPNAITLFRLVLVPVTAWLLWEARYPAALSTFATAAVSDLIDGAIARHYRLQSALGAWLDPIADKLIMLTVTVLLAVAGLLPAWLAAAIVVRDLVIASGAIAYLRVVGHVEMAPTKLSKLNTALEFAVLALVLAAAAGLVARGPWLDALFVVLAATVALSGAQYVYEWSRKAAAAKTNDRTA